MQAFLVFDGFLTHSLFPILTNADSFWLDVPECGESMPFNFFSGGTACQVRGWQGGRVDALVLSGYRKSGYHFPRT